MGMLASAFLSAESGTKAGQSAGGVQLRDREEGQREGGKSEAEAREQPPHQAAIPAQNHHHLKDHWVIPPAPVCPHPSPVRSRNTGELLFSTHEETRVKNDPELHS